MVSSNGGLNQMRSGVCFMFFINLQNFRGNKQYRLILSQCCVILQICDMVVVARYMNVTFVVPELDRNSFWNDQRCVYV